MYERRSLPMSAPMKGRVVKLTLCSRSAKVGLPRAVVPKGMRRMAPAHDIEVPKWVCCHATRAKEPPISSALNEQSNVYQRSQPVVGCLLSATPTTVRFPPIWAGEEPGRQGKPDCRLPGTSNRLSNGRLGSLAATPATGA